MNKEISFCIDVNLFIGLFALMMGIIFLIINEDIIGGLFSMLIGMLSIWALSNVEEGPR